MIRTSHLSTDVGVRIFVGNCLDVLAGLKSESVQTVVTSPPYWCARDYGVEGQVGQEATPQEYVASMVKIFREVRRVLRRDGTVWLNLGDCYATMPKGNALQESASSPTVGKTAAIANRHRTRSTIVGGLKPKELAAIPWRTALALHDDGWWLRQDIIWSKANHMPEPVKDRCTKSHEYIFLLTKRSRYYFDAEAIAEPAQDGKLRNKWSVWTVPTSNFPGAHFATFPKALIRPCILAGSPRGGLVLDPFAGSGTTGVVADDLGRDAILIEINPVYAAMAAKQIRYANPLFGELELIAA